VTREVERLDGLALPGRATLGPLRFSVPGLLGEPDGGADDVDLTLRSADAPLGVRQLFLGTRGSEFELRFPVLNPEIGGTDEGLHPVGDRSFLVHAPVSVESVARLRTQAPQLVVLGNARTLWNEGRRFVETLDVLRSGLGSSPLLWAPRVALPHRIPLLAYLGIDLVDTTEGTLRSAQGAYLDASLGCRNPDLARDGSVDDGSASSPASSERRTAHARRVYRDAIRETRAAAHSGRLRELVEARLTAEPALSEMLRYADRILASALETTTPVAAAATRSYVLAESRRRPEMVRFRTRLLERYRPPPGKSVLLLVPCSKTKPYRRSRSHRRFASALEGVRPLERVHVVSVSSPIGVVPRELEDMYPARHYDIPVTGDWAEDERAAVVAGVEHLRQQGSYRSVVVHLDPSEYAFVRELLPPSPGVRWTISDHRTTSPDALRSLREAVATALEEVVPIEGGPLAVVREELKELASVQFGRVAADRLFATPARLAGRPWFQRLTDGRIDLATLREERGLFHLTLAGARRMGPPYSLAVEADPSLPLTGDLFVPGVRGADPAIRVGDSVILLRGGELAGVGEAMLPGPRMTELERGLAVRIRHRVPLSTDTPMTAVAPVTDHGPVV
jgi:archaeosine synthase alpha-subunit